MNSNLILRAKWSFLTLSFLLYGTSPLYAQLQLAPTDKQNDAPKKILGGHCQELLKRYGKPSAFYCLDDATPREELVPLGVPRFSSKALPVWGGAAAIPLGSRRQALVWLYRRDTRVVSYLINGLGFVEASCIVRRGQSPISNNEEFEVSVLPQIFLGDEAVKVLERYGTPIRVVFSKWTYSSRVEPEKLPRFHTTFTLRDNQVVRVYSTDNDAPGRLAYEEPFKTGRGQFFLLKPK